MASTRPSSARPARITAASAGWLLLLLLAAGGVRWWSAVAEPHVKPDEAVYVSAALLWSEGRSPYDEPIFFYTPVYAAAASALTETFGSLGFLQIQRAASLAGISISVWLALLVVRWRWWPALATGVAWLWLAPTVALPTEIGNAAGVSAALTLGGLCLWQRAALAAGASVGLGLAIKPLAPLAPACFLARFIAHRDADALRAGLASATVGAAFLLIGLRFLPGIFANAVGSSNPYNFSLQHILSRFGVGVRPLWVLLAVGIAALWWMASRELSERDFLVATITANLLVTPILWAHSLLILLPIQLLAIDRIAAWLRRRDGPPLRHGLAALAVASTVLTASVGGLGDAPSWLQGTALAIPYLSIAYLGYFALDGRSEPASQSA